MRHILSVTFVLCLFSSNAQDISNYHCDSLLLSLLEDEHITHFYDSEELANYYLNEPNHLIKIDVEHNYSYKVYKNDPVELSLDRQMDFISDFNVRKYDHKRKMNSRTVLSFEKYGVTIELLSIQELNTLIENKLQESQSYILTSFPANDPQTNYNNKNDWATDYPEIAQLLNL